MENHEIKELFSDILKGSSYFLFDSLPIYIKHFSLRDSSEIDIYQSVFYEQGRKNGLKTEKEQELFAIKQKIWSEDNKNKLQRLKDRIETIKVSIKEIKNIGQKILLEKEFNDLSKEINSLELEKKSCLGLTLENYVAKKIDNYYILSAIYLDSDLKIRKFKTEEFEDLTEEEISELIYNYNNKIKNFTSLNIKKLALLPSFSNLFYLCNDDPMLFYGKSVIELSFYQAELFQYGKHYKQMFSMVQAQPPEDIRYDPIKLEDWFELSINIQNTQEKLSTSKNKQANGVGIVGNKEDLKRAGIETGGIDLAAAAKKAGGTLDFKDFIRLHK